MDISFYDGPIASCCLCENDAVHLVSVDGIPRNTYCNDHILTIEKD